MEDEIESLTELIIQCIIIVHQTLGPGFLETVYRRALLIEFRKHHLEFQTEIEVLIYYDGHLVGRHRLDILVNNLVILELKTVEQLNRFHYAQIRSYLKSSGLSVGLLVNFATEKADFRRVEFRGDQGIGMGIARDKRRYGDKLRTGNGDSSG